MKNRHAIRLVLLAIAAAAAAAASAAPEKKSGEVKWQLHFTENFKGRKLDEKLWSRLDKGTSDWNRNMSPRVDLVEVKGGQLLCWGKRNSDKSADSRDVLTGGVSTKDKFAMKYGKVEFKIKLAEQKGAWPAVWMMPQTAKIGWPSDGEIDILERLNSDNFVYQTVHGGDENRKHFSRGGKGAINPGEWNVYGLEWTPEALVWTVNGKETFRHARQPGDDDLKYPWNKPFYVMIDMQLGGSWVGAVDASTLPTVMRCEWVKFYHGSRDGKRFSEFIRPKAK